MPFHLFTLLSSPFQRLAICLLGIIFAGVLQATGLAQETEGTASREAAGSSSAAPQKVQWQEVFAQSAEHPPVPAGKGLTVTERVPDLSAVPRPLISPRTRATLADDRSSAFTVNSSGSSSFAGGIALAAAQAEFPAQAEPPAQEELPLHPLPLPAAPVPDNIRVTGEGRAWSVSAVEASLSGVLTMLAKQEGLNIVSGDIDDQRITVNLQNVTLDDAFNAILAAKGYTWARHNNIVIISSLTGENSSAAVQGREVRVYNLNYVTASGVESVVTGLLSPVGKAFIQQTSPTDQRQTHEQLVVEDLPTYLKRIEAYLAQADTPPRQVLVEAHVLQVSLRDELRHGVNFNQMLRIAGSEIRLETPGFASDAGPTTVLRLQGHDLTGLVEAIKTTTDAKTLASPKVAVLNGQEARMQVGGQIGYLLTTTTQTSTLQSVDFLDVGVILSVTPIITDDQQVLMQVRPQVSTGRINATTQLPESETTEVQTMVMLADGEAMVIGGLIQEIDNDAQSKIPLLGNIKHLGWLFQRRQRERERSEIIIALVPRIIPAAPYCRELNPAQVDQASTPLLHGPLQPVDRRIWEPKLPDPSRGCRQPDCQLEGCQGDCTSPPAELQF